jgi:hypothetical protein
VPPVITADDRIQRGQPGRLHACQPRRVHGQRKCEGPENDGFGQGDKGFVVINGERSSDATVFGPEGNGWFQTGLAPGKYCDVIKSHLSTEKTKCVSDNGSQVAPISVFDDGKAQFVVAAMDAVAIHVDEKIKP